MSNQEPLELQLQRERLARIRIESELEEAKLQIVQMELTLRQLRDLLVIPGLPVGGRSNAIDSSSRPASAPVSTPVDAAAPSPSEPVVAAAASNPGERAPRKRPHSPRRESVKVVDVVNVDPIELNLPLEEAEGQTATITHVAPPPIVSTLPLHENDNREVIREFIDHIHTRIEKMQGTLASMNLKELKWHSTWLRENAAKVGFEVLVEPLAAIEVAIDEEDNGQIGARLDEFIQLTDRIALEAPRKGE